MRSSRLLAASTLLALSLGATAGTATAGAAAVSPTPTPPATATAEPSTTPTPTGTPSATPTGTPSATASPSASTSPSATAKPSGTATKPPVLPTPSAPTNRCQGGVHGGDIKVTGTGLWDTTLVKGGPAQEVQVTFENTTGVDISTFSSSIYITDEYNDHPLDWRNDFFTVQLRLPGSDWKAAELVGRHLDTGTHKLAKGEKLTIQFRIAANTAPVGAYGGNLSGGSEPFDNTPALPKPGSELKDSCTQYRNEYQGDFKVTDKAGATAASSTAASHSASPTAVSGPHLAETGSSSTTLPIAVGGAVVLAAGAGTLLALRRRKAGAHG
ncbi:LAETG motif-containing sortase-dependent surface protein [Kitasatospora sp. NPDC002551]|uniref:LAETG motif-containing sortase-dependent surface protein n=1 Tax=Kitasatospora sp. NPDC002551 TaxID=3154539 RepID=UPI00331D1E87